jgi:glucose dehydrogenase
MRRRHVLGGGLALTVTSSEKTARAFIAVMLGCLTALAHVALPAAAWEHWGGDRGGARFSPLQQITPANVNRLVRAWQFRTGDLARRDSKDMAWTKFEGTPLFVESSLILCRPFNEVIAVDPGTGVQKWRFDPKMTPLVNGVLVTAPASFSQERRMPICVPSMPSRGGALAGRIARAGDSQL